MQLGGHEIEGFVPYDTPAVISMSKKRRQVIEAGSLDLSGDINLLGGVNYDHVLAGVTAGSLFIDDIEGGLRFRTRGTLARTQAYKDIMAKIDGGLVRGVKIGYVRNAVDVVDDPDPKYKGWTLEIVRQPKAEEEPNMACEVQLLTGDLGVGSLRRRRRRRRR